MARPIADTERDAVELCLAPELPTPALQRLGDERIWSLYREMVRNRLRGELKTALKRTRAAAGDALFERAFVHHLETAPPRARFFHAIVGDFARAAVPFLREQRDVPAYLPDLLAYEAAVWAVGDLDDRPPQGELEDFDFDRRPQLAPALRLLHLQHAVHLKPAADGSYAPREVFLCVHRRPEDRKARTWTMNAVTHDLMQRFAGGETTVTAAVQAVASEREVAVDAQFIDGLCTVLADFIERGIILGCRR